MIVVPRTVARAVAEHAGEVHRERPGHESLGVLVMDGDRAARYVRLGNDDPRPGHAGLAAPERLRRRGADLVVVHSHPDSPAIPSPADLVWFAWHRLPLFAIFSRPEGRLRFWRLDGPIREVELEVA